MTTQPDSSSPSSSSSRYDVFLSFRGADTRTNFTNHLHNALVGKGIHTFIDDDELPRGEEIAPALLKAIEDSRISLIVFSENFAYSRWCLDELVEILQCKESKQQIVLPIFYKVDPSDVGNQRNKFGDAFNRLIESKFKDNKKKVLIWKEALTKAAELAGYTFKDGDYETKFINKIVDGIFSKVPSCTPLDEAKYPVEIQSRVQDVKKLLDVGGNGRRMVGIWGTSGIGKTTITKAIWNDIAHKFEGSCFFPNVREASSIQLLGKNLKIGNVDEGIGVIKERLRHKKILLILDDVDQLEQLEKLAGDDWFGEGSRVIITTKNRRLLANREIELIYEVKKLDYNQALELFSWHAFKRSEPPKDYLELAQRAIAFADGLPLALEILGAHLRGIDIQCWQDILDSYEGEPYTHIERILQKSYDALDDRAKEAFLDIACFFKGEDEYYVPVQIVPKKFIEEFVDKALITIEWRKILMHDLLANLGKEIVRKEFPNDPGRRSRLWFYEDVEQVLTENTGTRNIKGIMVKLLEPAEITLNPECFRNMVNLQIFINHNAYLCGDINFLPNALRFIDWPSCQLQSLPSEFHPVRLVVFNMPCSRIRQLEIIKHLPNLTRMNMIGCQFLEKIPDLSGIPNIKYLLLSDCTRLVEIDDSVGLLGKLVVLTLHGCVKLTRFGTRLRLKSLEILHLWGCEMLESFPEIQVEMESLREFRMEGSGIRELPPSIAYLTGLRHLDLAGCFNLTRFPTLRFKSLEVIDLCDCKRLESFPELQLLSTNSNILFPLPSNPLSCLSTLRTLILSGNNFITLPECIRKFVSLDSLILRDCKSLLEIPQEALPPRVGRVYLDNCTSLEKIPKLPLSSEVEFKELSLINCVRLRGYDITENIFLDQVSSHPRSEFTITLPGDEVPKWFNCIERSFMIGCTGRCEVCFEIPPNLDWETLRLVLCVVNKGNSNVDKGGAESRVHINGRMVQPIIMEAKETHVALTCIPLLRAHTCVGKELTRLQQGNMCQLIFEFSYMPTPVKILCGVHLLGHQVADLTVDRRQRYEAKFINEVVEEISVQVLNNTYLDGPAYPVGIKPCVTDVNKLLRVDGNGHCTVGIWGTAGIGKTTIAKAVYNSIASKFEGACFLTNVREKSSVDGGLLKLQEALLCQVLGGKNFQLFSVDQGINVIKQRLSRKRILLILDDVNQLDQLHNLARVGWFGEGSRVVVTTRDKGLLTRHGIELIYEVKKLDDQDALELLSGISFERKEPPDDYLGLARRAIACAQYLPLALTILGSYLRNQRTEYWNATLHSYEADPYVDIQKILRTSYDGLKYNVQQVFLDIACFFKGEDMDYVIQVLKGPKLTFPESCIQVLLENAIITIDCDNTIQMHDLLEIMGKDIVHEESPNEPGKRSRLWFHEDVHEVLTDNAGTSTVKGIMIKLPKHDEIPLNVESFSGMKNLEFFINRNARLCGDTVDYPSNKLRVIDCSYCQLQYLPSNFHPEELVVFNMPYSRIRRLEKLKHLPNLTRMNMTGCQFLEKIPDLSGIPNIEYLILSDCTRLVEIDNSVGLLHKLVDLQLDGCVKLTRFATRLRLKSLRRLYLVRCERLESFPEIEVEMESLMTLHMEGSGIRELPLSIAHLTGLRYLDLAGCFNLTRFGTTLRLKSLETLDLSDCEGLESFLELQQLSTNSNISFPLPSNPLYCLSTLRILNLSGNNFVTLPECISKFVRLYALHLRDCKSLLEIPQEALPPRVSYVYLDNCTSLEKIPKLPLSSEVEFKHLSLINCVRLRGNDITENIILDQVSSHPHSEFTITLPGDKVPKWFSCCKDATLVKKGYSFNARCEFCFEIPPNLDWETLRLVLCVVNKGKSRVDTGKVESRVHINRKMVQSIFVEATKAHVALNCIPLLNRSELGVGEELTRLQQGNMCQIIFEFYDMPTPVKILCGVHLLGHQVADVTVDSGQRQWLLPDAMATRHDS